LPLEYLESFLDLSRFSASLGLCRPAAVYSTNSIVSSSIYKFLVANWSSGGTQILNSQHGGSYGFDFKHRLEEYEISVSDRYYTWGWSSFSSSSKTISLGLPRKKLKIRSPRYQVLVVTTDFPVFPYRLQYSPITHSIFEMHSNAIELLRRLQIFDTCVKPYGKDYGWNFQGAIVSESLCVDISSAPAIDLYPISGLVVHTYLSTSYLETLYYNIPTVVLCDLAHYKPRPSIQPLFELLVSVGIVHFSPQSAFSHINSIADDPMPWWSSADVQSVRYEYLKLQNCTTSNSFELWTDEILTVLDS